jgi:hypothetical protein
MRREAQQRFDLCGVTAIWKFEQGQMDEFQPALAHRPRPPEKRKARGWTLRGRWMVVVISVLSSLPDSA